MTTTPSQAAARRGRSFAAVKAAIKAKDWDTAEALVRPLLDSDPDRLEALFALAVVRVQRDDLAGARDLLDHAIALAPDARECADLLAVVHGLAGDLDTSVYYGKLATALAPSPRLAGLLPEKFPTFAQILRIISERPLLQKAVGHFSRGAWHQAEYWLRQHLAFEPDSRDAHAALGACLLAQGAGRAAVEALRAARHRLPMDAEIASLLGRALAGIGSIREAEACHRWAQMLAPENASLHATALVDRLFDPATDAAALAAAFRAWGERFGLAADGAAQCRVASSDRPLTVGYLIAGQAWTPSGQALADILSCRDAERFPVVGFGHGDLGTAANARFQVAVDRWQDIADCDPLTLAAMVQAERVDVLVDVAGFSAPQLLVAFGRRMAPCQAAWIDAPLGTGLAAMDCLLTDRVADPGPGSRRPFVERLVPLDLGCVLARLPDDAGEVPAEPPHRPLVFAADVRLADIHPWTVEEWARVLHAEPESILVLRDQDFRHPDNLAQLVDAFGNFGLAHRVEVAADPRADAFYGQAHVLLQPLPYPQPQAALEALWWGVPVVCPLGEGRHGRLAASLLHHLGLAPDMVAASGDDYLRCATGWAADADARRRLRQGIRQRLRSAPCMDPRARARDLEAACLRMWSEVARRTDGASAAGSHVA